MKLSALALIAPLGLGIPVAGGHGRLEVAVRDEFDPALLRIAEDRHLGQRAADVRVQTESGPAQLRDLAAGRPMILLLGYFSCHDACPTMARNLAATLRGANLPEHRVLVLSFDANDTMETLRTAKSGLESVPDPWTFGLLSPADAARLTESIGYRYFFSERDGAYVHPGVLVFLSPDGQVTRYLYGSAPRLHDIELALTESGRGAQRLNDLVNMARLVCYRFDPARSRYVLHPALIFGAAGIGVLGLAGLLALTHNRGTGGAQS